MAIRLRDLARQVGVSDATVCLALQDDPRVNLQRRRQIQKLAHELDYRPHSIGRALKAGRSMSIGLAMGSVGYAINIARMQALERAARERGYWTYMALMGDVLSPELPKVLRELANRCIDGLVVYQTHALPDAALEVLGSLEAPVVYLDWAPGGERRCVVTERASGQRQVARHLAELGHRRAWYFRTASDVFGPQHRVEPYRRSLTEAGVELVLDERAVLTPGENVSVSAYRQVRRILADGERPTVLIMSNDEAAAGAASAIEDAGLRVPEDISVVGFDDTPAAAFHRPALTTVRHAGGEAGQAAFELLLKLMEDPRAAVKPVRFESELIVRQSTGPARV